MATQTLRIQFQAAGADSESLFFNEVSRYASDLARHMGVVHIDATTLGPPPAIAPEGSGKLLSNRRVVRQDIPPYRDND